MEIKYVQSIYNIADCDYCNAEGTVWEKEYHNRVVRVECPQCKGKKKVNGVMHREFFVNVRCGGDKQ